MTVTGTVIMNQHTGCKYVQHETLELIYIAELTSFAISSEMFYRVLQLTFIVRQN